MENSTELVKIRIEKTIIPRKINNYAEGIIVNWSCEWHCNLKCTYCCMYNGNNVLYRGYENKKKDVEKSKNKIISLNPSLIRVSGGEPTLVKDLHLHLKELKEKTSAKICLNSNGLRVEDLKKCEPYVDNLQISYDGNGEVNSLTRGINGDFILKSIKKLYSIYKNKEFTISTVLTIKNKNHLEEIGKTIKEIDPKINWVIIPVEPISHELSTIKNLKDQENYNKKINELKKEYNIYDLKIDTYLLNTSIRCKRGLKTYYIYPDGLLKRCWEQSSASFAIKSLKKSIKKRETKEFFKTNKDFLKQLIKPDCAICPNPCNCNIDVEHKLNNY